VGGISLPWWWIVLPKHFMRLNGVFRWNLAIIEGLRWSAWMSAAPQHQDVGTTWWRVCKFWHKTQGVEVPNLEICACSVPVQCRNEIQSQSNTLKSASMPKQEFWYYIPFLRSYLHTKQKKLCDVSMWVLHPLTPSAPSPISYIIYHFKVRNNHVCEIRRFKGVKCLRWVTTPKTD